MASICPVWYGTATVVMRINALNEVVIVNVGTIERIRHLQLVTQTDMTGIIAVGLSVYRFSKLILLTSIMRTFASIY